MKLTKCWKGWWGKVMRKRLRKKKTIAAKKLFKAKKGLAIAKLTIDTCQSLSKLIKLDCSSLTKQDLAEQVVASFKAQKRNIIFATESSHKDRIWRVDNTGNITDLM